VGLIYSLLKHLILVTCCVFKYFRSWKRFTAHEEHSCKFLQSKGGKNIVFLDENIPYLEGRRGVLRALTKKIDPG
jgi:hypothetical protein